MWMLTGTGWWTIEHRETGALAGMVGAFFRETLFPLTPDAQLELGWTIVPAYWRRGFASEAAAAALASGLERTKAPRAIAQMDPANTGSIGVAKAIGMTYAGETSYYGAPSVLYAVTREAYCATANKKST
jgi:RimJ/RimL family protein N-acetyltransferase